MAVLNGGLGGGTSGITNLIHNVSGTNVTHNLSSLGHLKVSPNVTGLYFNIVWQISNGVAGAITEYYDLSEFSPAAFAGASFFGGGNNTNMALVIYYDVAAGYDTLSITSGNVYQRRYSAAGTAGFTRNSAGTWDFVLADVKRDIYQSDVTNFPSSRSDLVLNPSSGAPAFRFRTSVGAVSGSLTSWFISGFMSISE